MMKQCFDRTAQHSSANPAERFAALESRCRGLAAKALERAYNRAAADIENMNITPQSVGRFDILKNAFDAASGNGAALFEAEFEATLSLSARNTGEAFHEALVRLHDGKGGRVFPDTLFEATDGFDGTDEAGRALRLWIFTKQMKEFYETHDRAAPLSLNINPIDMRNAEFRKGLEEALSAACDHGCRNVVLEALEQAPWEEEEALALKGFRDRFGVKIAIDDYGARKGYHNPQTLQRLAPDFVKLDGHLVRDFIEKKDGDLLMRLREIQHVCPKAHVVAEWVASPEEINDVMERLRRNDLPSTIHLVQGRDLHETPRSFLSRLAALRERAPYCPVPNQQAPAFA